MDFNKNVKPQTDWQGRVIGYKAERIFPDPSSASRGQDLLDGINPAGHLPGFVPFGDKGEPFDPPERCVVSGFSGAVSEHARRVLPGESFEFCEAPWPSDKDAEEYAPQAVSTEYAAGHVLPPNCLDSGYALAHAQHEAATDGDECTSGACLITRGSD